MQTLRRDINSIAASFEEAELNILRSLLCQLIELLSDARPQPRNCGRAAADDIFSRLERELGLDEQFNSPADYYLQTDPVLTRLFPKAYVDDEYASDEFARYTQPALMADKLDCAQLVLDDLQPDAQGCCVIPTEHYQAWFKSLTNLRLALAVRLDIEDADDTDRLAELPDDNPNAWVYSIYEWLGWVQECLLAACDED